MVLQVLQQPTRQGIGNSAFYRQADNHGARHAALREADGLGRELGEQLPHLALVSVPTCKSQRWLVFLGLHRIHTDARSVQQLLQQLMQLH